MSQYLEFLRYTVFVLCQNFIDAEIDFRKKMELTEEDTTTLFYTGLSQYYRGKVRVCTTRIFKF